MPPKLNIVGPLLKKRKSKVKKNDSKNNENRPSGSFHFRSSSQVLKTLVLDDAVAVVADQVADDAATNQIVSAPNVASVKEAPVDSTPMTRSDEAAGSGGRLPTSSDDDDDGIFEEDNDDEDEASERTDDSKLRDAHPSVPKVFKPPTEVFLDLLAVPPSPIKDPSLCDRQERHIAQRSASLPDILGLPSSFDEPGALNLPVHVMASQLTDAQRLVRVILGRPAGGVETALQSGEIMEAIRVFANLKEELERFHSNSGSFSTINEYTAAASPHYARIVEMAKKIQQLEAQLVQANRRIKMPEGGEQQTQEVAACSIVEASSTSFDILNPSLQDLQQAHIAGQRRLVQIKQENNILQSQVEFANLQINRFESRFKKLEDEYKTKLDDCNNQMEELTVQLASVPKSNLDPSEALTIRAKLQTFVRSVANASSQQTIDQLTRELEKEREESRSKIQSLEQQLASNPSNSQATSSKHHSDDQLQQKRQLQDYKNQIQEQSKQIDHYKDQVAELEKQLREAKNVTVKAPVTEVAASNSTRKTQDELEEILIKLNAVPLSAISKNERDKVHAQVVELLQQMSQMKTNKAMKSLQKKLDSSKASEQKLQEKLLQVSSQLLVRESEFKQEKERSRSESQAELESALAAHKSREESLLKQLQNVLCKLELLQAGTVTVVESSRQSLQIEPEDESRSSAARGQEFQASLQNQLEETQQQLASSVARESMLVSQLESLQALVHATVNNGSPSSFFRSRLAEMERQFTDTDVFFLKSVRSLDVDCNDDLATIHELEKSWQNSQEELRVARHEVEVYQKQIEELKRDVEIFQTQRDIAASTKLGMQLLKHHTNDESKADSVSELRASLLQAYSDMSKLEEQQTAASIHAAELKEHLGNLKSNLAAWEQKKMGSIGFSAPKTKGAVKSRVLEWERKASWQSKLEAQPESLQIKRELERSDHETCSALTQISGLSLHLVESEDQIDELIELLRLDVLDESSHSGMISASSRKADEQVTVTVAMGHTDAAPENKKESRDDEAVDENVSPTEVAAKFVSENLTVGIESPPFRTICDVLQQSRTNHPPQYFEQRTESSPIDIPSLSVPFMKDQLGPSAVLQRLKDDHQSLIQAIHMLEHERHVM